MFIPRSVELTELVAAIANETAMEDGMARYEQDTASGISLESITITDSDAEIYLDPLTNPIYSLYMYAF